ncbi:hypothetical protein B0H21DRAFT_353966 [Amylocystis lapponica]|nr:hypothetical protein B0H21DRAFT_353966 [Amylocystis lapponica]
MASLVSPIIVLALFSASSYAQGYPYDYPNRRGLGGGAIAGIVIAALAFLVFMCICSTICFRRRRAARVLAPSTSTPFGLGGGRGYGYGGNATAQQPEYGGGPQAGWNGAATTGGNFTKQYQPPAGAPPSGPPGYGSPYMADPTFTPQPGGYALPPGPPPPARTRF